MNGTYKCPMIEIDVDESICYDIQMVTGPGATIQRRILDDYGDLFDQSKVTDEAAAELCKDCPFNQLKQPAYNAK